MRAPAGAVALVLLTGCTPMPTFGIENEMPVAVALHVDRDDGTLGWQDKLVVLHPGEKKRFRFGTMFSSEKAHFSVGGCEYEWSRTYSTAQTIDDTPIGVVVQPGGVETVNLRPVVSHMGANGQWEFERLDAIAVSATRCSATSPP